MRCWSVGLIDNVLLVVADAVSLPRCMPDDDAVFFHEALKIGPLHAHIPRRPRDIPIISLQGMNQKISFHLLYGFQPEFFLDSL